MTRDKSNCGAGPRGLWCSQRSVMCIVAFTTIAFGGVIDHGTTKAQFQMRVLRVR